MVYSVLTYVFGDDVHSLPISFSSECYSAL